MGFLLAVGYGCATTREMSKEISYEIKTWQSWRLCHFCQRSPGWKLLAIARFLASVAGQRTKQAIAFMVWTSAEK